MASNSSLALVSYDVWRHVRDKNGQAWQCVYCQKLFHGGMKRVIAHLAQKTGEGIALCNAVPVEVNKVMCSLYNQKYKDDKPGLGKRHKRDGENQFEGGKHDVDMAWAKLCYGHGIPLHVLNTQEFKVALEKSIDYGKTYFPPSAEQLRSNLLQEEFSKTLDKFEEMVKNTQSLGKAAKCEINMKIEL